MSDQPVLQELRPAGPLPAAAEALPWYLRALAYLRKAAESNPLAVLVVGVPVVLATFYFGLIASNVYVSEAHFIVRMKSGQGALGGISESSALHALTSMSASLDDTQSVNDYLGSRDAMDRLVKDAKFLELLARPEADFLSRFPRFWSRGTQEALFERFPEFVAPSLDTSTGISTLHVYAFRAGDARDLARSLLAFGEERVNHLNDRAREDAIVFARETLAKSEEKVKATQTALAAYRDREGVFDPKRQGAAVIELIGKLNGEIAQLKTELNEVSVSSPGSPKINSIKVRIAALETQADKLGASLAGGNKSLASKLAAYERLALGHDLATKSLAASLMALEGAVRDAQQQRLYLQRVVEPNLPDYPLYPKRLRSILIVLAFSLCIYWVLKVLGTIIWEHEP